jgi:hypothetical protein
MSAADLIESFKGQNSGAAPYFLLPKLSFAFKPLESSPAVGAGESFELLHTHLYCDFSKGRRT